MSTRTRTSTLPVLAALFALLAVSGPARAAEPSRDELVKMVTAVDDRQRNGGDYRSSVYIEQKEANGNDLVYQAQAYRRDADDKLMILFVSPKSEAGKGYLRLEKNLWMYDPTVGKWERRTERERIGGTDSRRADFDESRLAEEYDPKWLGEEKLGKFQVHKVELNAKPGVDVAYPVLQLWIDQASGNVLKRQEFSLSRRAMRTAYYPKWDKKFSESKGAEVWFPREIRIFDEIEKGNSTVVLLQDVDLAPLPANIFTKAWLEAKSK